MSTYLIVNLVEKAAKVKGLDIAMEAFAVAEVKERAGEFDILLLGPQVKYKAAEVQAEAARHGKKFAVIPSDVYGSMDGDKVIEFIMNIQ